MKRLNLFSIIFLLLAFSCYALTPWGVPAYVDIAAYAVNDYSQYNINNNSTASNLPRSIIHKNEFIGHLQGKLNAKYPNTSSTVRYNRENSTATRANFLNDNTDLSEFVFFSGHGNYNTLAFYDFPLQATAPTPTKTFGNYTRWIIFDACLTLNASPLYLASWLMGGAHAILGVRSMSWQFSPSQGSGTEDQFKKFTTRYVIVGNTIWSSHNSAVKDAAAIYINAGLGIEPAIAFWAGNADNGQYVNFSNERLQNVYNGPFSYQYGATNLTINWLSYKYGKPQY